MRASLFGTKVFAFSTLIFLSAIAVSAQPDASYRLNPGTRLRLRMDTEINSSSASRNDTFTATLAAPLIVNGVQVLPEGVGVEGRVTDVSPAAFGGRDGRLDVRFETLKFGDGRTRAIEGSMVGQIRADPKGSFNTLAILGGLGAGTLLGSTTKTAGGTLAGAGVGAGVGTAVAFLRKGKELRIRTGQEFEIEVKNQVILPARDY